MVQLHLDRPELGPCVADAPLVLRLQTVAVDQDLVVLDDRPHQLGGSLQPCNGGFPGLLAPPFEIGLITPKNDVTPLRL